MGLSSSDAPSANGFASRAAYTYTTDRINAILTTPQLALVANVTAVCDPLQMQNVRLNARGRFVN